MTLTLSAILSLGRLEVVRHTPDPRDKPELALGEVEALVAYCRLEVARHLRERDAANSHDGRLALEEAETELLTAMQSIASACAFIERDMDFWRAA